MKLSKCCDEEVKFKLLTSFYKCKQSGEILSEDEMLNEVDEDDALDSFYLIGDFETKEEAIDHLKTIG